MSDINLFSNAMIRVINEWKYSCEHNLTCVSSNRIAWIGQAAVCIATGAPESCTRAGWYQLEEKTRIQANKAAQIAIDLWESNYLSKHKQMELFDD